MIRILVGVLGVTVFLGYPGLLFGAAELTLSSVEKAVLKESLSLRALEKERDALKLEYTVATAWETPMLGIDLKEAGNLGNSWRESEVSFSQMLPISRKLSLRQQEIELALALKTAQVQEEKLNVLSKARVAFADYWGAFYTLNVINTQLRLWAMLGSIAQAHYAAATGGYADILKAEIQKGKLEETQIEFKNNLKIAVHELSIVMNLEPAVALGAPESPPITLSNYDFAKLLDVSLNHPQLLQKKVQYQREVLGAAVLKEDFALDPVFKIAARPFSTTQGFDMGIELPLPWFTSTAINQKIAASQQRQEGLQLVVDQFNRDRKIELVKWLTTLETDHHHLQVYTTKLVPLAKEGVETSRTAYLANKAPFSDLVMAQLELQDAEMEKVHHQMNYYKALWGLPIVVGVEDLDTKVK